MTKHKLFPLPEVVRYYESTKRSFCFTFKAGWAHFSVDAVTGEFSVQSDWGDYSHRWPVQHIGAPSMFHFLAQCDAHYIVDKLSYGEHRTFREEFDEEATIKELRVYICEQRREGFITKDDARHVFDDLERNTTPEEFYYYEAVGPSGDNVFRHIDIHEYFVYEPSTAYRILVEQLIPLFQEKLKELGYGKEKREVPVPPSA